MPARLLTLPLLAALAGCGSAESSILPEQSAEVRIVPVVDGLEIPWSMAFLPNGDMLVTERPGRLRLVSDGVLHPDPIVGVPSVRAQGQGGLLEVALHPDFAATRWVYLTYSKPNADANAATTALARARLDGHELVDLEELLEIDGWSAGGNHFGSRLVFDPDGYLFMTMGDRGARPEPGDLENHPSQDLSTLQGKIIRLNDDGSIPADNPFVSTPGVRPEIWSYGHRSPQGFALDPATGDLWETEHGPQGGDELNLIEPGRNYGWPVIGYGVQYGGDRIHDSVAREGMEQPVHYWVPSIATSGLVIYSGDAFPEWRGSALVGGLAGQTLVRVGLENGRSTGEEMLLEGHGRIRDVRQGPDGFVYIAFEARGGAATEIVRLEPR